MNKLTIEEQEELQKRRLKNGLKRNSNGCGGCKHASQTLKELKAQRLAESSSRDTNSKKTTNR